MDGLPQQGYGEAEQHAVAASGTRQAHHAPQQEEYQECVGQMDDEAGDLVSPGVDLAQVVVHGEADRGQRAADASGFIGCGSALQRRQIQRLRVDLGIGEDIGMIVEDEWPTQPGVIDQRGEQCQQEERE